MPKKYDLNESLKSYIEGRVDKMKFDDEFKPIVCDILLRRIHQYELDEYKMQIDLACLEESLQKVNISKMPDEYGNANGLYNPVDKTITLAKDYAKRCTPEELYQTFTHEIYHALTHTQDGSDRLMSFNQYTGEMNTSLLEVFIEKASYKTVFPTQPKENAFINHHAIGYADVTFVVDAIEAAYGVSEQELLKNGIQDRDTLKHFLSTSANELPFRTEEFLDSLEANLTLLNNSLYNLDPNKRMDFNQMDMNVKNGLSGIYSICEDKIQDRMMTYSIKSVEDAKEFLDRITFDQKKLTVIMMDRIEKFAEDFKDPSISQSVLSNNMSAIQETNKRIIHTHEVIRNEQNFPSVSKLITLCNWARAGNLVNYDMIEEHGLEKLGINLEKSDEEIDNILAVKGSSFEKYLDPYYVNEGWDNFVAPVALKKIAMDKELSPFQAKMKNIFTRISTIFSKQKALPSAELIHEESEAASSQTSNNFGALTKEELEIFNKKVERVIKDSKENQEITDSQNTRENNQEER